MCGRMVNFLKKCADKGYVKITGAVCFVACTVAACKYPHTVSTCNNLKWLNTLCQVQGQTRNSQQKFALSGNGKNAKKKKKKIDPLENEIRIVVIGATEFAKSTTGSILRKNKKTLWCYVEETLMKTVYQEEQYKEYKVDVIDTPPIVSYYKNPKTSIKLQSVIKRVIAFSAPGLHAFILCIPATEIHSEFTDAFTDYERYINDDFYDFVILAFTHYEDFDKLNQDTSEDLKRKRFIKELESASEKEKEKKKKNVLGKMKNVSKNYIVLNTYMKTHEKTRTMKHIIEIIRQRESKRGQFWTDASSQGAESVLQARMSNNKESKTMDESQQNKLRDTEKMNKAYHTSLQIKTFKPNR